MADDDREWPPLVGKNFGERLRELRKRAGLSQLEAQEMAEQYPWAGVSVRSLSRFENGDVPNLETVVAMLLVYRRKRQNQWPGIANELRRALLRDVVHYLRTAKPLVGKKQEPPAGPGGSLL